MLSGCSNQSQNDPLNMSCCYEPKGNNKGKVKLNGLKRRCIKQDCKSWSASDKVIFELRPFNQVARWVREILIKFLW